MVIYMPLNKINIRGVFFTNGTSDEVISEINERISSGEKTAVFTPNSEIVQSCIDSPELFDVINSAELTIPDGIGVIKAAKILKTPLKERIPGIELGMEVLRLASEKGYSVGFLGGKPGIAEEAASKISEKYPDISFSYLHDGYFNKTGDENEKIISEINESETSILFVCLGAPAQEKWICKNRTSLKTVNLFLGLGGSLDVYSGNVKRSPDFFCKHGLEWLYRLITQPSRIIRMMKLPKFYFGTVLYKIKNRI